MGPFQGEVVRDRKDSKREDELVANCSTDINLRTEIHVEEEQLRENESIFTSKGTNGRKRSAKHERVNILAK